MGGPETVTWHRAPRWLATALSAGLLLGLAPLTSDAVASHGALDRAHAGPSSAPGESAATDPVGPDLDAMARGEGEVSVIVTLDDDVAVSRPQAGGPAGDALEVAQDAVIDAVPAAERGAARTYDTLPALAMMVTPAGLAALEAAPGVADVSADLELELALDVTVPHVAGGEAEAIALHDEHDATGQGQAVAIVDSGVDATHPAFGGRVLAEEEACFSGNGDCPNGEVTQLGPGAAAPVVVGGDVDTHGTHVAGTAAGTALDIPALGAGVAPEADLVAVQVTSVINDEALPMGGDLLFALEHLLERATDDDLDLAAVNLSLGTGQTFTPEACRAFEVHDLFDALARDLGDVGVAVVAAAGNQGVVGETSFPACVDSIVAVGATDVPGQAGPVAVEEPAVADYSNASAALDLLAPGTVVAATAGGGSGGLVGTSMATPHVAGAFAALQGAMPRDFAPAEILEAMRSTGEPVDDERDGAAYPELRAGEALAVLERSRLDEAGSRLAGAERYATAAALSAAAYPQGAEVAYLASGLGLPDALAGGVAAATEDGPLLLTRPDDLPEATAAELAALDPDRIVVLGGTSVVSDGLLADVEAGTGARVSRLAGEDRFATAAAVAEVAFEEAEVVYVATGRGFPDGLAGAPAAALEDAPLLLTERDRLPEATAEALERLDPDEIVVLGGSAVVDDAVLGEIAAYAPVERLAGDDRYATAVAVAGRVSAAGEVFVATGGGFADALAAGAVAGSRGSPVLLTATDDAPEVTLDALTALEPERVHLVGGASAISEGVGEALQATAVR